MRPAPVTSTTRPVSDRRRRTLLPWLHVARVSPRWPRPAPHPSGAPTEVPPPRRPARRASDPPPGATRQPRPGSGHGNPGHDQHADSFPLRRLGRAEDVAAVVAFAFSDDADHITGTEIVVDGGYLAMGH
ncbi:SDR family oxidoreductase [Candidatus Mycolicibacterium alkanivorans]|uniref:SDR family oxidoreductase n=1 Tax=Candidatus Mycolicibacterium alkanivorans TaxID=2954114 RepID=A0ABS9YU87_9MYCO|nr:SDR family oxidoreductase [Candidatus Mycolicibacterium alkanivorans]MCI4674806.1 SDR family oxidoreductase [Candidatus Mycolicibacterium alkanivorans]